MLLRRACLVAVVFPSLVHAAPPPSTPSVAEEGYVVIPFENASGVKALDWMAPALPSTLGEQLESHPFLRPVYGGAILEGFGGRFDEARVAARARDLGARWVFGGSFSRPNWKAEVTVRLYQVASDARLPALKLVAQAQAVGERNALLDVLDQALLDVLKQQGWSPEGDALAAIKRRPTRDLYAFTIYGRALGLFYGLGGPVELVNAQKLFTKSILIDPKFAEAHRMLGLVHVTRGEFGKGMSRYAAALDLRPGYYAPLVGLAQLYRAENRRQPALEMAERALAARPGDVEMRFLVGDLEWEAGDLDKALADLLLVVGSQPGHLKARRTLAMVYAARGDTVDLAAELERIAALAPDDLDVKLDLGSAYMRLNKNEQAITAYEDVLKKQPRHLTALKFSGDLYRRVGETERAIAAYEKMRRLASDDPRPYFLLGAAYAEAGNDVKAEQILQEAQEFRGHLGEAWTDLGAIAYRRGDYSKATWYLERAVARAPNRPKAHFNYALVLNATKQRDKALAELKTAGELDPEDAECHYLAGVIYLRLGRLDEAKDEFAAAVKRKPDHGDAKHNLALLEDLERRYGSEHAGVGSQ